MSLFGPPDVKKLEAKRDVVGLIDALAYKKNSDVRGTAARALGDLGDSRAVEPLIAALRDDVAWVRTNVAGALGELRDPRAVEPLIAALGEPAGDRRNAVWALGQIGDPRAIHPLVALFKDDNHYVCEAAASALGQFGAEAVEPITVALRDQVTRVRENAAGALGELRDPRAIDPLVAALRDNQRDVRKAAAQALGKIGDPRAIEPLVAALRDRDSWTRRTVAEALEVLGWIPGQDTAGAAYWVVKEDWKACVQLGTPAVEVLVECLQDEHTARLAAETLGQIGDPAAVPPLINLLKDIAAHQHLNGFVRDRVIGALGEIGPPAINLLIAALSDEDMAVQGVAVDVLTKLDWNPDEGVAGAAYWVARGQWDRCVQIGAPAIGPLVGALRHESSAARKGAAEALGHIGDPKAVEPLIAALPDSYAAKALGEIGDDRAVGPLVAALLDVAAANALISIGAAAVEPLIGSLDNRDESFRLRAVAALGQLQDLRAVEPVIRALQDENESVREAAAQALGQLGDSRAVEPLVRALDDVVDEVRRRAATALGDIGDSGAVESLVATLSDRDWWVRKAATGALDELGWSPDSGEAGAAYWAGKGDWERCREIGAPGVEPLIAALQVGSREVYLAVVGALVQIGPPTTVPLLSVLRGTNSAARCCACAVLGQVGDARVMGPLVFALKDKNKEVRAAAAGALDSLGWSPDNGEAGATYWVTKREWGNCVPIGAPAVEVLVGALGGERWADRKAIAETLVAIYRSGGLDEDTKAKLLAQRGAITGAHADQRKSVTPSSDCTDHFDSHTDSGIGIAFPM